MFSNQQRGENMAKLSQRIRNDFSDCSTGNANGCYYSTKGHAVNAFDARLQTYDLCLDRDYLADWNGNEGRVNHPVCDEFGHEVGCAVFTYYRMESGRYEVIGYLA